MAQNNGKKSFAELPKSGTKNYNLKILISGFSQPFTQFFRKVFPYTIK